MDHQHEQQEILSALFEALGEDGCGMTCCAPEIFENGDGWHLLMEGFLEPWPLGRTVEDAKASIHEYTHMGFGMH
jgi:hypothetical protein